MGQVLIRNLPDDLIDAYKAKARLNGEQDIHAG
jgi:plasmid stability protein